MTNPKHPITNGEGTDITEAVQILYDTVMGSMEMGSGLYSEDEMRNIINAGIVMGWELPNIRNNGPGVTLARQFPEHYDIYETVIVANPHGFREGQRGWEIVHKGKTPHLASWEKFIISGNAPKSCPICNQIHEVK